MSKKSRVLSLPKQVMTIGIYFFYFLVQLQLQFVPVADHSNGCPESSSLVNCKKDAEIKPGSLHHSVIRISANRLNKRFSPKNIFGLLPAQFVRNSSNPFNSEIGNPVGRDLVRQFLSCVFFRGPPVFA